MKFFKFINDNGFSLAGGPNPIEYVKGETIEVKDANPDTTIQCSSGIHCIYMQGDDPIQAHNVVFGPKVAILEAKKSDVIYFSTNGKCRLKKCRVRNIIPTEKLPVKFILGNGNISFANSVIKNLSTIINIDGNFIKQIQDANILDQHKKMILSEIIRKIEEYTPDIENVLLDAGEIDLVIDLVIKNKKYFDPKVPKAVLTSGQKLNNYIQWANIFGHNPAIDKAVNIMDIIPFAQAVGHSKTLKNRVMENGDLSLIEKYSLIHTDKEIEEYLFNNETSAKALIQYALKYKKNDHRIIQAVINNHTKNYSSAASLFPEYVKAFPKDAGMEIIAEFSAAAAVEFYIANDTVTPKMKELINSHSSSIVAATRAKGYDCEFSKEMAVKITDVISLMSIWGVNEELIDESIQYYKKEIGALSQYNTQHHIKNLLDVISNTEYNKKLEEFFFFLKPSLSHLIEYCYYWGFTNEAEKYIQKEKQENHNFYSSSYNNNYYYYNLKNLQNIAYRVGYYPFMEKIFNILNHKLNDKDYTASQLELLQKNKCFYKVVRVLKNGSKVSAFVDKNSKKRMTYFHSGKNQTVNKAMVFDNYFSANAYKKLYGDQSGYNYGSFELFIVKCNGDSFQPVSRTINWKILKNIPENIIDDFYKNNYSVSLLQYAKQKNISLDDVFVKEIRGSGWLHNVQISQIIY